MPSIISLVDEEYNYLQSRALGGTRHRRSSTASTCTLGDSKIQDQDDIFEDEVIDLTQEKFELPRYRLLKDGEFPCESYRTSNLRIRVGDLIEVDQFLLGNYKIQFVLVRVIAQCRRTGNTKIRGVPFARTRYLLGKLPKKANELCMILHLDQSIAKTEDEAFVDVDPSAAIKRRSLNFTNAVYPKYCANEGEFSHIRKDTTRAAALETMGTLTCR